MKWMAICLASVMSIVSVTPALARCNPSVVPDSPYKTSVSGSISASSGYQFPVGSTLYSPSGNNQLIFQGDGNLVLYPTGSGRARWDSNTQTCKPTTDQAFMATFQTDGNLVIYWNHGNGVVFPVWDTRTDGHPNATLIAQDDGNLVIYDNGRAIWALF